MLTRATAATTIIICDRDLMNIDLGVAVSFFAHEVFMNKEGLPLPSPE